LLTDGSLHKLNPKSFLYAYGGAMTNLPKETIQLANGAVRYGNFTTASLELDTNYNLHGHFNANMLGNLHVAAAGINPEAVLSANWTSSLNGAILQGSLTQDSAGN
jgi:hypothetical protein